MRGWHRVLLLFLAFEIGGPAEGAIPTEAPGGPRIRPAPRHETVPKVSPGPAYEWVGGRWVWTGQKFEWVKGGFKQRMARPWRYVHGRFIGRGGITWQPGYFSAPNEGRRVAQGEDPDAWRRWRRDPPVRR